MSCSLEDVREACEHVNVRAVHTPEWGGDGTSYVRAILGEELDRVEKLIPADDNGNVTGSTSHALAMWCILAVCDEAGSSVFTEDDRAMLLKGPLAPMKRCVDAAIDLNGLSEASAEELEKN